MVVMRPFTTKPHKQRALDHIARHHYGVLWMEVLTDLGVSRAEIRTYLRRGEWRSAGRSLFVVCAVPRSWEQDLMIMCRRAPGRTWVSGRAAARLWKLDGFDEEIMEVVTVANLRRFAPGRIVHNVRTMPRGDVTVLRGLPVTTVHRTLIDVGDTATPDEVELAYECARRRRQPNERRETSTSDRRAWHQRSKGLGHARSHHLFARRESFDGQRVGGAVHSAESSLPSTGAPVSTRHQRSRRFDHASRLLLSRNRRDS